MVIKSKEHLDTATAKRSLKRLETKYGAFSAAASRNRKMLDKN
jgi:hypothetical protein